MFRAKEQPETVSSPSHNDSSNTTSLMTHLGDVDVEHKSIREKVEQPEHVMSQSHTDSSDTLSIVTELEQLQDEEFEINSPSHTDSSEDQARNNLTEFENLDQVQSVHQNLGNENSSTDTIGSETDTWSSLDDVTEPRCQNQPIASTPLTNRRSEIET